MAIASPAYAQTEDVTNDTNATSATSSDINDDRAIVITGSRIARPNLTATVPIQSISSENLERTGSVSLVDSINRLPALRASATLANSTGSIGDAGIEALDLRGLGTSRTLVLLNGRRTVTSSPGGYVVDVNTIPATLLERVDVVTGGNSAIYGSDAVAGVVNFITKRNFDGIHIYGQGGISSRGDRGSQRAAITVGQNFAEGRGNIAFSANYTRAQTLWARDRDKETGAIRGTPGFFPIDPDIVCNGTNPTTCDPKVVNNSDGIPDNFFSRGRPGNRFNIVSMGGTVLTNCPAATATNGALRSAVCAPVFTPTGERLAHNYMFQPDGSLARNIPDLDLRQFGGSTVLGGLGATGNEFAMLQPGIERINLYSAGRYEFSPAAELFFDARYVRVKANQSSPQPQALSLGGVTAVFSIDNPYLTDAARNTLTQILPAGSTRFQMIRFLSDGGARTESHKRETFAVSGGLKGQLNDEGSINYEIAANWGRTKTFYRAGGNFMINRINNALNAVRNSSGTIVCGINADADTANDDAACRPINIFGEGSMRSTQDGVDYALADTFRRQWAEQFVVTGFVSADSSSFFELPGGPVGLAIGGEYRREDAFSAYDDATRDGLTTLNALASFDPPAIKVKEAFAEIRIPILKDIGFFNELTLEASGRISDYSNVRKAAKAYNLGLIWAPFEGVRLRGTYAQSVRAPTLSNAYATGSETFAQIADPCSFDNITLKPNREQNCRAAGIPLTLVLPDGSTQPWRNLPVSSISGLNRGNPDLEPEKGRSWTVGGVFQTPALPGFSLSIDYYNIEVKKAIASLGAQTIINQCYDEPSGIDNIYCRSIQRRRTPENTLSDFTFAGQTDRRIDGLPNQNFDKIGPGFTAQPFNFARLKTSGVDAVLNYRHDFGNDTILNLESQIGWLRNREQFVSVAEPNFSERQHGEVGDPIWRAVTYVNFVTKKFDVGLTYRWFGRQSIFDWETQHSHQGRPPTNEDTFSRKYIKAFGYVDMQVGARITPETRAFIGVDNLLDKQPPFGSYATGGSSAVFDNIGRYFYAGIRSKL